MRVAIVHYWLLGMRGGERVVEALCRLAPGADIFTLFYDPEKVSPFLRSRRVKTSFLNPMKWCYRSLLPLAPIALEHFDLRGYELVSYKRLDLAVRYFSRTGRKLRVAGDGPQARELRRSAGASVEFCGRVPD